MPAITTYGYLELPYLVYDYSASYSTYSYPTQVEMRIDDTHVVRTQVNRQTDGLEFVLSQVNQQTSGSHEANSQATLVIDDQQAVRTQVDRTLAVAHEVNTQVDQLISESHTANSQATLTVEDQHTVNMQVNQRLDKTRQVLSQVNRMLSSTHEVNSEVRRGSVLHSICEDAGYLVDPYLMTPYLVAQICAHIRTQVDRKVVEEHFIRSQVNRQINSTDSVKTQVQRRIDDQRQIPTQVNRIRQEIFHTQVLVALYNTTRLRILCEFPSRGSDGLNWTANSTEPGDFSVNNVNTDIVEQVWRSASGVKTGLVLTCDTDVPQGIFMDTLAILNHNMTVSATVQLQGSNDAGFGSIGFNENLELLDEPNIYYIAPTLPTSSYRYWRFIINDGTNTEDHIQIGTIVFGNSIIFQGECFIDEVIRSTVHFSDKVATEGFTNVSNDRALKYATQLSFRNLDYNKNNYKNIRGVFRTARTSLKCLWIPTPQYPERFAVFGKLREIPVETHNALGENADYIQFNVDVDESL